MSEIASPPLKNFLYEVNVTIVAATICYLAYCWKQFLESWRNPKNHPSNTPNERIQDVSNLHLRKDWSPQVLTSIVRTGLEHNYFVPTESLLRLVVPLLEQRGRLTTSNFGKRFSVSFFSIIFPNCNLKDALF